MWMTFAEVALWERTGCGADCGFAYFALIAKRFLVALSERETVLSRYGRSIVRKASRE
jgi:hypothetical protein